MFAAVIVLVAVGLAVRGVRSATLIADARGLRYRSLVRTRCWSWDQIDHLEVTERPIGMSRVRRRQLVLVDQHGRQVNLVEMNASPTAHEDPIGTVAEQLNRRLASQR